MEDIKKMMEESIARDAERRAKALEAVKAQFPQYDIDSCKNNGASYSTFKVYLNVEQEIRYEGYGSAFQLKTDYGYTMEWYRESNKRLAIVELGSRLYVFEETSWLDRIHVTVFNKATGARIKGERHARKGHETSKGIYVELNGSRVYLDFQDAPAEPAIAMAAVEEVTAVEPAATLTVGARITHKTYGAGTIAAIYSWNTYEVSFDNFKRDDRPNGWQQVDYTTVALIEPTTAITFMIDLEHEEIVSEIEWKLDEHYESDDLTLIYDVVTALLPAGQLLKMRDRDGDLRYASFIEDGAVRAWDLMTNTTVYAASADGCKHIHDTGRESWYSMNPVTGDWVHRAEVASSCVNAVTGQQSDLVQLEGPEAEAITAAWLNGMGWVVC